jgi:hypothetical protein
MMRPSLANPPSRYGEREYSSNKNRKFKALNLQDNAHSPQPGSDIYSAKNNGLPPIMPKTRSQASLNAIRNNIKELTRGGASGTSNVQSIIEQGRRESKQMIIME